MGSRDFYIELHRRLGQEKEISIQTVISGRHQGKKMFVEKQTDCGLELDSGEEIVSEIICEKPCVVICGGGHISLALVPIMRLLDFHITVIDDREEFANRERFNQADEVRCVGFEELFQCDSFSSNAYYVIMTRGHKDDSVCLLNIIKRNYAYVGMIGSRKKVSLAFDQLRQKGYTEEQIGTVHAPIGLMIGGETPGEIAVSIAAQIVEEKNKYERNSLEGGVVEGILQVAEPGVMVTIIDKNGSSPRGMGTRMVVRKSGAILGTIGGGAIEYAAVKEAIQMIIDGNLSFQIKPYDLSNSTAAELGMVCGGDVKVMFEIL